MDETLFLKLQEQFPISQGTKKNSYLILFDAYTGMGKSTVSKCLAHYDHSIILNNDEIRAFLNDYKDQTNYKDIFQHYRLEQLLRHNNSCIMDSCLSHNYQQKLAYYDSLGYKYYIIRLECKEETIKKRLQERSQSYPNSANYEDYLWMKNNVSKVPDNLISYTINTEEELDPQIQAFLQKYNLKENL